MYIEIPHDTFNNFRRNFNCFFLVLIVRHLLKDQSVYQTSVSKRPFKFLKVLSVISTQS